MDLIGGNKMLFINVNENSDMGFYNDRINKKIPETAKLVSDEIYSWYFEMGGAYVLTYQAFSQAQTITKDLFVNIVPNA